MKIGDIVYIATWESFNNKKIIEKGIIIDKRKRDYTDIDPEREPTDNDIDFLILWSSNGNIKWVPKTLLNLIEVKDE